MLAYKLFQQIFSWFVSLLPSAYRYLDVRNNNGRREYNENNPVCDSELVSAIVAQSIG